jgi:hypothetical protein
MATAKPTETKQKTNKSLSKDVIQRLKRETYVSFLGLVASSVEMNATVLPTLPLDPRVDDGSEVLRINDGTPFSGEYQITEVSTTYALGKRSRTVSGIGIKLDGLTSVPTDSQVPNNSAHKAVDKPKASTTAKTTNTSKPTNQATKPTAKPQEMFFDTVNGVWKKVGG